MIVVTYKAPGEKVEIRHAGRSRITSAALFAECRGSGFPGAREIEPADGETRPCKRCTAMGYRP